MKRIWHPYTLWEEVPAGMWESVTDNAAMIRRAIQFTGDTELYSSHMRRVIQEWPYSCQHNLTDTSQNRKAWIGHAAAAMAIGSPEHITRHAWGYLTEKQQQDANQAAQEAIDAWIAEHERTNPEIRGSVGAAGIPRGDSGSSTFTTGVCEQGSELPPHL